MLPTPLEEPVIDNDPRTQDLRSLRRLITSPTQHMLDDVAASVAHLQTEIHTPDELTKLLVPVIAGALRKNAFVDAKALSAALAPVIDSAFRERTEQDKSAIVDAMAPSVAKALREHHERFPDEVAEDLAPIMGAAIREQVRLQRDAMVDALYPIIGSMITKYMSETLRELIDNVNHQIEQTLSFQGILRRIKAKASGVSEAELILKDSMPFGVRAAFLIHKASGILLAHAYDEEGHAFDTSLVSGMLTAIRSFVNDWIARMGDRSELDAIEYGRSRILLEAAGHCYLAVVVDGEPPEDFVDRVRETLSNIVAEWDKEIATFSGDHSIIPEQVTDHLKGLLRDAFSSAGKRAERTNAKRSSYWPLILVLILLIALPFGWYYYANWRDEAKRTQISAAVGSALGYDSNPIAIEVDGDEVTLAGSLQSVLLQKRAIDAARIAAPEGEIRSTIAIAQPPVHAALLSSEVERVTDAFNSLGRVHINSSVVSGVVTLTGHMSDTTLMQSIIRGVERVPGVSAVKNFVSSEPESVPAVVRFTAGTALLPAEMAKIDSLENLLKSFTAIRLRIIGHCDLSGSRARNLKIAEARAQAVQKALILRGIHPDRFVVVGTGDPIPNLDPSLKENRCVRFEVIHE